MNKLDKILLSVEKPARYIGGEYNAPKADWKKLNYCICFPDVYEVGMSNLGIRIVAESLRTVDGVYVDRAFAPWRDYGEQLKKNDIPLYALSTKRPLKDFDMIGFSLGFEMCYTTVYARFGENSFKKRGQRRRVPDNSSRRTLRRQPRTDGAVF